MNTTQPPSLEVQRAAFARRRFLAMPLAGTIAWTVVGIAGATQSPTVAVWTLFIATGSIVYLGLLLSQFTGEAKERKNTSYSNTFDILFLQTLLMSLLVFSIAIPFFLVDHTSLPLTVGILTGLMWAPLSWIIQHWVGLFHAISRTAFITVAWHMLPDARFTVIPAGIVAIYISTTIVLEMRWRQVRATM